MIHSRNIGSFIQIILIIKTDIVHRRSSLIGILYPFFYLNITGLENEFSNFERAAYSEWVDHRSWDEMATFRKERFGEVEYGTMEPITNRRLGLRHRWFRFRC